MRWSTETDGEQEELYIIGLMAVTMLVNVKGSMIMLMPKGATGWTIAESFPLLAGVMRAEPLRYRRKK